MVLAASGDILGSVGSLIVIALTLGGTVIVFLGFGFVVSKFNAKSAPGAAPATQTTTEPLDAPAQRRMLGLIRTLDQIGGSGRANAKRALMVGRTDGAKAVFKIVKDDKPTLSARGLALIAEHDGDIETASAEYARMYEGDVQNLGTAHPQARQGAHFYAGFLRDSSPDVPALAQLEARYGPDIGK